MTTTDYKFLLLVDQTPDEVFEAIKNVRGWWSGLYSEEIEGATDKIGDEFTLHAGGGVHYTKQKLTELIPGQKIVWLITDSQLTFVPNQTEWTGTKLRFEISEQGDQTQIVFTHVGLVPAFQCYDACAPVWTQYMERLQNQLKAQDFSTSFWVDQTPHEVFNAVNNVRGWWSERIDGGTDQLNDVFIYQRWDLHKCTMKLIEVVPDQKVVWLCLDNYFSFTKDQQEWVGTTLEFAISEKDGRTQLCFTHHGLTPAYECYAICFDAWTSYINGSLQNLITTGKGQPNAKEELQKQ